MASTTVFCPFTTTGAGRLVVQTAGEARLVVDSRMRPVELVGQDKMTFDAAGVMVNCGVGNEMLNTVP